VMDRTSRVLAMSGGIGGAKLALGLARVLAPGQLTVVVNTGDDFEHLGLAISPDLDTLLYTLAGLDDPQRGWGRRDGVNGTARRDQTQRAKTNPTQNLLVTAPPGLRNEWTASGVAAKEP